ncbi:DUF4166 domain-containing protein [Devosia sp.]|uniref:DUF4166 domain-containing protein n=1 Tax=Devosia sp. TaxID=1871048 RepID=UPI0032632E9D
MSGVAKLTVLIVGGYGTFGGRLALLLAEQAQLRLIIAGRSIERAAAFIATLPAGADKQPLAFDRDGAEIAALIRAQAVDIVVDATGPFQGYGTDPYRLVRASLEAGAHYLDLADSSEFVGGIVEFDQEAKRLDRFVLSGVSSFPVLTAAVLDELSKGLSSVEHLRGGIAPSPYAGIGPNVIEAILSYSGQAVGVVREGKVTTAFGMTETMRFTIAPPGRMPLRSIRFSLVDVPDLLLLPQAYTGLQSVWMGAGTRPEFLHRLLNGLGWLVRLKLLPTLTWLRAVVFEVQKYVRWGEHRGGMFVEVTGSGPDGPVRRSWHLLAEGSDGPLIPSMAVQSIVLKMLDGMQPESGARPAVGALTLADYDRVFAGRMLYWGLRDDSLIEGPLYQRCLGAAWVDLPPAVRDLHDHQGSWHVGGVAQIETGSGLLSGLARRFFGFPAAGSDVPVTVEFIERHGVETWTRRFGDARFSSVQLMGRGLDERLIVEKFGPVRVSLAVVATAERLTLVTRRWTVFGIPLPLWLGPRADAYEFEQYEQFHFHVELSHPLAGLIVRYTGWLKSPD